MAAPIGHRDAQGSWTSHGVIAEKRFQIGSEPGRHEEPGPRRATALRVLRMCTHPRARRRCLRPLARWRALCWLYQLFSQSPLLLYHRVRKRTMMLTTAKQRPLMSMCKLLGLLAVVSRSSVSGLDIDVLTCADVQNITAALVQDHITARFADLRCEEWQTVVAHEMDEERELRIESLPNENGQQQQLYLKSVRFDIGRGVAVTFASDVRISRSAWHPQDTDGGALNVHDSSSVVFLGDLVLEHMEVEGSGGGMYIANDATVEVHGRATFHELGSKQNGGAVCTTDGGTFVAYGGITATNNYAHNGGALFNLGHIRVETEESEFRGNSAPLGAALYNGWGADGVMFFAPARFENNRAFETADEPPAFNGEHIYSKNYVFFEEDTTFVEGQTAIYVDGGLVEFEAAASFSGFTDGAMYTTYEPIYDNLKFAEPPHFENNSKGVGRCAAIAREQQDGSFQCIGSKAGKRAVN